MIDEHLLMLFLVTTFVVVLSPGPAVIAVVREALSGGFKQAFGAILGIAVANVVYFILSATGIAALIIASSLLFMIIKWLGVLYLLYLGSMAIFSKNGPLFLSKKENRSHNVRKAFLRGFYLELANPKALLYFSALLPQFINITEPIFPQLTLYCLITFALDLICYSLYAYLASRSTIFSERPLVTKVVNRMAGSLLIFAGLKMAVIEH